MMRRLGMLAMVAAGVLAGGSGCGKGEGGGAQAAGKQRRGPLQFPVEVAPVEARDVEYTVNAVGSVEAFEVVQITARVPGVVERVLFAEGQEVKKGQVLAEIEPTRYSLEVEAAEATLRKAEAASEEARAGAERRVAVNTERPGLLPQEELVTFQTRARTAEAEVGAAKAALSKARLDLRDAYVKAPMDGVLQTRTVQTGQYVQPGAVLATLLRREPLLVRFTVPESEVARLQPGMTARFTVRADGRTFSARITHVAAAADAQSRMVAVTAEVTGEDAKALRPGAFATVSVPVGESRGSPVVPQTAVRASERGFLAYVVEDGKARERVVTLGLRTADGRVEVREGVNAGEMLVVRGGEALSEGASVRIVEEKKPAFTGEPRIDAGAGGKAGAGGAAP